MGDGSKPNKVSASGGENAAVMPFEAPARGELLEIAPGIFWSQLPLPFQPYHVNTYLVEDEDGWLAIDTGQFNDETCETWERIVANLPHKRRLQSVMVTHWHTDHLGAAGWLCERHDAPLLMSEAEYCKGMLLQHFPRPMADAVERQFQSAHGLEGEALDLWVDRGHDYLRMSAPLPHRYRRLAAGDELSLKNRTFSVRTAAGHSPEEIMLRSPEGDVYLCADQMGPKIAPNLAVQSNDPLGNPLDYYLRSLDFIAGDAPESALLLPGHEAPFRGLDTRISELRAYYARRCDVVEAACGDTPMTAHQLVSHLFLKPPGPVWIGFVLAEAVTYANYLVSRNRLVRIMDGDSIRFARP